jgi:hypothetical protein
MSCGKILYPYIEKMPQSWDFKASFVTCPNYFFVNRQFCPARRECPMRKPISAQRACFPCRAIITWGLTAALGRLIRAAGGLVLRTRFPRTPYISTNPRKI